MCMATDVILNVHSIKSMIYKEVELEALIRLTAVAKKK